MTAPETAPGRPGRTRRTAALVAVIVILLAAIALTVGAPRPGEAFDPGSVGPDGLAGLVDLLEAVDVDVEVSRELPSDMSIHLFIATERLGEEGRQEVGAWADAGGTVVVAGPSPLHGLEVSGGSFTDAFGATPRSPGCDLPGLADVGEVEHADWRGLVVADVDDAWRPCFDLGDGSAWLVAGPRGEGSVVALGSAVPFVNANLDRADNAVLAAALLAPEPGDRVVIMPPAAVGEGETAVTDVVPAGFWRLLWLAIAATVVAVIWRARRLGPPVEERLPPVLPSAELAHSVAALLQRAGDRETAASRLRGAVRNDALRRLGLPHGTDHERLMRLVSARTGTAQETAELALLPGPVGSDAELLELAGACHSVRDQLRHPAPTGDAEDDG